MALFPSSLSARLQVHRAVDRVANFFGFSEQKFSPEESLLEGPVLDPRLQAKVPMSNANIDTLVLNQLSGMGMKRGKEVTLQSHPELMRAWQIMSARAGLKHPPQLIIADSDVLNALTFSKQEVAITTGLLKVLDLRETCAVLAHELGHAQSNHLTPRAVATGVLGGGGLLLGNRIGHMGGIRAALSEYGVNFRWLDWLYEKSAFIRVKREGQPVSLLGYGAYMAVGTSLGGVIANHLTVRPTELDADAKGAMICNDPLGLAAALRKLDSHSTRSGVSGTASWILSGYPTAASRISKLEAMAASMPTQPPLIEPLPPKQPTLPPLMDAPEQPAATVHDVSAPERMGTPVRASAVAAS